MQFDEDTVFQTQVVARFSVTDEQRPSVLSCHYIQTVFKKVHSMFVSNKAILCNAPSNINLSE